MSHVPCVVGSVTSSLAYSTQAVRSLYPRALASVFDVQASQTGP